jgi:hypothetical protein
LMPRRKVPLWFLGWVPQVLSWNLKVWKWYLSGPVNFVTIEQHIRTLQCQLVALLVVYKGG